MAVCEKLNIQLRIQSATTGIDSFQNNEFDPHSITDIRSLKEYKKPSSAMEMACLVALYLSEILKEPEKKDAIDTKDIEKYFKQAVFPLPKVPGQVLIDAKAAGYFDSAKRGKYKLNPVGYNLAVHLLPRKK